MKVKDVHAQLRMRLGLAQTREATESAVASTRDSLVIVASLRCGCRYLVTVYRAMVDAVMTGIQLYTESGSLTQVRHASAHPVLRVGLNSAVVLSMLFNRAVVLSSFVALTSCSPVVLS